MPSPREMRSGSSPPMSPPIGLGSRGPVATMEVTCTTQTGGGGTRQPPHSKPQGLAGPGERAVWREAPRGLGRVRQRRRRRTLRVAWLEAPLRRRCSAGEREGRHVSTGPAGWASGERVGATLLLPILRAASRAPHLLPAGAAAAAQQAAARKGAGGARHTAGDLPPALGEAAAARGAPNLKQGPVGSGHEREMGLLEPLARASSARSPSLLRGAARRSEVQKCILQS